MRLRERQPEGAFRGVSYFQTLGSVSGPIDSGSTWRVYAAAQMTTSINVEPVIALRLLASGCVYAYPLAAPTLVCRANSVAAALEKQQSFLTRYLAKLAAWALADFMFPTQSRLQEFPVVMPRADLASRFRITKPVTVPCYLVPEGRAHWVHILPLGAVVFVEADSEQDLQRKIIAEVSKAAAAGRLDATEYLAALPATEHRIERLSLTISRPDIGDLGERSAKRRARGAEFRNTKAFELLGTVGEDMVKHAKQRMSAPIVARVREIATLAALLSGRERLSVVLVGPQMAGKSAIVHGLVDAALRGEAVGAPLRKRKIFATSGAQLVAGQSGFGQLQERIGNVLQAAEQVDAVIYFDNLGDLLAGRAGSIEDMIATIRPFVADDRVRLVGELTPEQLEHYEKQHVGFFSTISRLTVEPLDKGQTAALLERRRVHLDKQTHRPNLTAAAIKPLVELSERYLSYLAFPGKAVRLYEELRATHETEVTENGQPKPIGPYPVYQAFSVRSGIPLFLLRDEQAVKFSEIVAFFSKRVIGQRESIRQVAQTLCMVKAGLQAPAKPLANFLFVGPTGVGKTEVAKTLARFLFGGVERLARFDMSEYTDPMAAERLIRGSERDEGELTRAVRQQPFCVVLLDEIEKAHRAVFDLLLQVCGEGRLTDARGKTTWFHNAIIIMTSNLGAAHRRPDAGFSGATGSSNEDRYYLDQVENHFRPEFVNRIDRVIPFRALGRDENAAVARVSVERIRERDGLLLRGVTLTVSDAALAHLATSGYSPQYGARALRRHLEDALVVPMSAMSAKFGERFAGTLLEVATAQEKAAAGTVLEQREVAGLNFALRRASATQGRQAAHHLRRVSALRRAADRALACDVVQEVRERMEYVVADLASGAHDSSDYAALNHEHSVLHERMAAVESAVTSLATAEELVMAAGQEHEDPSLYSEEAELAYAGFERAYTQLVLGRYAGNATTFISRAYAAPQLHHAWLETFLRAAQERQWDVTLHRYADSEGVKNSPAASNWGPPKTAKWTLERLQTFKTDARAARAQEFATVLLRVRGPCVGGLLRLEMGITRIEALAPATAVRYVELFHVADHAKTTRELTEGKGNYSLPEHVSPNKLEKLDAPRRWMNPLSVQVEEALFEFEDPLDYWRQLERVQFSRVVAFALAGEQPWEEA